jgi:hypothetical protein
VTFGSGNVGIDKSFPLVGQAISVAQQSMGAPGGAALTGVEMSISTGSMFTTNDRDVALTGQAIAVQQGITFASSLGFAIGQQLTIAAQEIGPRVVSLTGLSINVSQGQLTLPFSGVVQAGGRKKHKERYIARYRGRDHEFSSIDALDSFVEEAKREQKDIPKRNRAPIKITINPEFVDKIDGLIKVPARISEMPTGAALAQVRRIESMIADLKPDTDENEDFLLWLI